MLHKLRQRVSSDKGFTLIELLVVILIIGILAAIALPSFLNQKGKAQDTAAKSDVKTAQTAEETYFTDEEKYTATVSDLTNIEPALNGANALSAALTAKGYDISVTSKSKDATVYHIITDGNGGVSRTCSTPSKGGCKSNGSW